MNIKKLQALEFSQTGGRDSQQDAFWPHSSAGGNQRVFLVCDGVGGGSYGEVASRTVCRVMGRALQQYDFTLSRLDNSRLAEALGQAYAALDEKAVRYGRDMATTLTLICVHSGGCTMAHIGDSRIYHIRPSQGILYRSDDHSLVNSMVHAGVITPQQALNHPQSNVITRFMGPVNADRPRCMATVATTTDVQTGDYFLLCSDGVLHCVSDEQLVERLSTPEPDSEKLDTIARLSASSPDNNTAILVHILQAGSAAAPSDNAASASRRTRSISPQPLTVAEVEPIMPRGRGLMARIKDFIKKH